jgi:hypothetical protein
VNAGIRCYVTFKTCIRDQHKIIFRKFTRLLRRSSCTGEDSTPDWTGFGGLVVSILAPRSRVRTRPNQSDILGAKIRGMPPFGGEVKPPVPCHRFATCKRSLRFTWKSESQAKLTAHLSPNSFNKRSLMLLDVERLWR